MTADKELAGLIQGRNFQKHEHGRTTQHSKLTSKMEKSVNFEQSCYNTLLTSKMEKSVNFEQSCYNTLQDKLLSTDTALLEHRTFSKLQRKNTCLEASTRG